ncbi:DMT family transporter [Patescibacteria group bacterium]|nr:DMT family transporter [Patescibacteria group bacterium]
MNPARLRAYIYLIIASAIWGIAGPVIKFTLKELPPFTFLAYRFFLTSIILSPLIFTKGVSFPKKPKELGLFVLIALLGTTINIGLLFWGLNLTTVLDQTIISMAAPLGVILAGTLILRERVTKIEKLGILIAIVGTVFIIVQPIFESSGPIFAYKNLFGNILTLISNFAWIGYVIFSKIGLKDYKFEPLSLTIGSFIIGFFTILPFSILEVGSFQGAVQLIKVVSITTHAGVVYMALLSGALAYFLYQLGQKTIEASEAILFTYLQTLFAIPLAVWWLKETITTPFILGTVLTTLGIGIAEYKRRKV